MSNDITELREHLFDTLRGLKSGSVDIDKARAVSDVAKTIIDSAKVEVDFMRVAEIQSTGFIGGDAVGRPVSKIDDKGNKTTVQAFPGLTVTTHKAR